MSDGLRLTQLRALLHCTGTGRWRWELIATDNGTPLRELIQEGASKPSGVFASGAVLTPQARAIAHLHPGVLAELSDAEALSSEARERLEYAVEAIRRVQRRAYGARQTEHYADLRQGLQELKKAVSLLQRNDWFMSQAEYKAWEQGTDEACESDSHQR